MPQQTKPSKPTNAGEWDGKEKPVAIVIGDEEIPTAGLSAEELSKRLEVAFAKLDQKILAKRRR